MANNNDPSIVATKYWRQLDDGLVECTLCPRLCHLREGKRGVCFIRQAQAGEIVLTSYGRSSGFCIDPIEKKPLNHYLPGTPVLSFGTAGCNLTCKFCQNWDISKSRQLDTLAGHATPEQLAITAEKYGCRSVAFTYNDPIIFMEYAIDVAAACRERDIRSVAVSAGYINPKPRIEFFNSMDAANIDLKGFTQNFYHKICGGNLASVLDTLLYLKHETSVWFEITTLIIPGQNDSSKELEQMTRWISDNLGPEIPLHFTAFHPDYKMRDIPATSIQTLTRAREIALGQGLHYVYTGNVHDPKGDSTWCPQCGGLVIERDWYTLGQWALNQGHCQHCGHPIAGVFETQPGQWGAKRLPVLIDTMTTPKK